MISFHSGGLKALFSLFLGQRPPRKRHSRKPMRRFTAQRVNGGEWLECRAFPSANPIVANPVSISGFENQALTNVPVATFTDGTGSQPASDFKTAIVWGDGATTAGTVIETGTTYTVLGSHTYADIYNYNSPVIVGIQDATNPAASAVVVDGANIAPILPDGTQGTPDQRFVYEYLKDTLQRPISMDEVNYWTGQFEKNHGDRQTFSSIVIEGTPPYEYRRDQIDNAYRTYLHRDADPAGENFFLQLVNNSQGVRSGPGLERRTAAILINSDEYYYQRAGGTVDGFITAVFEDALKRAPDPQALAFFEYQLTHGLTHIEFATTVLNSDESLTLTIEGLYERYLGRPADPAGIQAFLTDYHNDYGTETNTETLLDTSEFYDRAVGLPLNTVVYSG